MGDGAIDSGDFTMHVLLAISLLTGLWGLSGCAASRPRLLDTSPRGLHSERSGGEIDAELERKVTQRLHLPDTSGTR